MPCVGSGREQNEGSGFGVKQLGLLVTMTSWSIVDLPQNVQVQILKYDAQVEQNSSMGSFGQRAVGFQTLYTSYF